MDLRIEYSQNNNNIGLHVREVIHSGGRLMARAPVGAASSKRVKTCFGLFHTCWYILLCSNTSMHFLVNYVITES